MSKTLVSENRRPLDTPNSMLRSRPRSLHEVNEKMDTDLHFAQLLTDIVDGLLPKLLRDLDLENIQLMLKLRRLFYYQFIRLESVTANKDVLLLLIISSI